MRKKYLFFSALALLTVLFLSVSCITSKDVNTETKKYELEILCTSDLHGNVWGFSYEDSKESSDNGMARLYTYIKKEREANPDLILLDYEMPGWDGVQTLEMIRANKDLISIPILFLTGVSDRELVTEALKHKPQGYILKNSDRNTILEKVSSVFK